MSHVIGTSMIVAQVLQNYACTTTGQGIICSYFPSIGSCLFCKTVLQVDQAIDHRAGIDFTHFDSYDKNLGKFQYNTDIYASVASIAQHIIINSTDFPLRDCLLDVNLV